MRYKFRLKQLDNKWANHISFHYLSLNRLGMSDRERERERGGWETYF